MPVSILPLFRDGIEEVRLERREQDGAILPNTGPLVSRLNELSL